MGKKILSDKDIIDNQMIDNAYEKGNKLFIEVIRK